MISMKMVFEIWKSNFGTFWNLGTTYGFSQNTKISFEHYVDFWSKFLLILYPFLGNLTTHIAIAKILNFDECDARILFHAGSLALTKSFHAN